jgi:hypothetical protein
MYSLASEMDHLFGCDGFVALGTGGQGYLLPDT